MIDPKNHIISRSLLAGITIGIGGYLSLSCDNQILSAVLLSACFIGCTLFNLNLVTSKSGFLSDTQDMRRLVLVLLLNMFAAFMLGLVIRYTDRSVSSVADNVIVTRIDTGYLSYIIKSIITGHLMTLAIESENKQGSNHIVLILCTLAFVCTGCLHCIVDLFYYGASAELYDNLGSLTLKLFIVIVFNFIGCNLYNLVVNKSFIHRSE